MAFIDDEYHRLCGAVESVLADPAAMADGAARSAASGNARQAVRWCRDHFPAGDPELATALCRLARVDFPTRGGRHGPVSEVDGQSDWSYAHSLREAAQIFRTAYGANSEPVLRTLSMLSWGRCQRDEWSEAEATLTAQRDILRMLRGPDSPDEAAVVAQLGDVTARQGRLEQADAHYRRAAEIWGRDLLHPAAVPTFTGWGRLRQARGDLAGAMEAYQVVTAMLVAAHGQSSPVLADHLLVVAGVAQQQGDAEQVVALCRRAVAVQRAHLVAADPRVAAAWEALSVADPTEALDAARRALTSDGHWLMSGALATYDNAGAWQAETNLGRHADRHLALALGGTAPEELLAEAAGVAAWRRRLPELLFGSAGLAASAGQADLDRQRRSAAAELATLMQRSHQVWHDGRQDVEVFIEVNFRRGYLRDTVASLDMRLRGRTVPAEQAMPIPSPQVAALLTTLGDEERCVELVRLTDPARYHALVFGPGARIRSVDLGPAGVIDACALQARAALEGPGRAAAFRDLPARLDAGTDGAAALADTVIGPLLPLLDGCRRVTFVVGSGPLLHVPLGVLAPIPGGPPWLADMTVAYANGLDEVAARWAASYHVAAGPDVVLAAPDYDLAATDPGRGNGLFTPLADTRTEGERVAERLAGARLLLGPHALNTSSRMTLTAMRKNSRPRGSARRSTAAAATRSAATSPRWPDGRAGRRPGAGREPPSPERTRSGPWAWTAPDYHQRCRSRIPYRMPYRECGLCHWPARRSAQLPMYRARDARTFRSDAPLSHDHVRAHRQMRMRMPMSTTSRSRLFREDALTAALNLTALAAAAVQALADATGRSPQDVLQSLHQP